jgi:hypothetical protein
MKDPAIRCGALWKSVGNHLVPPGRFGPAGSMIRSPALSLDSHVQRMRVKSRTPLVSSTVRGGGKRRDVNRQKPELQRAECRTLKGFLT